MELANRVAIITGGSGGIGMAMAKAFLAEGAEAVVLADLDGAALEKVASETGAEGQTCDVTNESEVQTLVNYVLKRYGRVDLFCSNAGASSEGLLTDASNEVWQNQWELHVMAHLYAARAVLPSMLRRGCLLYTSPSPRD